MSRQFVALAWMLLLVPATSAAPVDTPTNVSANQDFVEGAEYGDQHNLLDPPPLLEDDGYSVLDVGLYALAMETLGAPPPTPPLAGLEPLHMPWGLIGLPFPEGVVLKWNSPLGAEPDGYRIYRTVDERDPELIAETDGTVFVDDSAWEANGTVLTYTVTATYSPGEGPQESQASNPVLMPGGLGSCRIVWAYPVDDWTLVDFGYNLNFLECIGSRMGEG